MKTLNIIKFMALPDSEKVLYTNRYFTTEDRSDHDEFDVDIFTSDKNEYIGCEYCEGGKHSSGKYIGTSDTREPKFCFEHYAEINKDSEFYRKEGAMFTQGPWIVDENGTDSIENMISCLAESQGTEHEWVAVGIADKDGYAESVAYCHPANAHIVATLPMMYDTLIFAANQLANVRDWSKIPDETASGINGIIDALNITIAKAEGR